MHAAMSIADVQFEFDLNYSSFKLKVKKLFCTRLVICLVLRYCSCYTINKSFFQMNDIFSFQTHQNSDATSCGIYEKADLSRAFNQFIIACELDMINAISAADIAFIMSSSTSAWLLSRLQCSSQKQNG